MHWNLSSIFINNNTLEKSCWNLFKWPISTPFPTMTTCTCKKKYNDYLFFLIFLKSPKKSVAFLVASEQVNNLNRVWILRQFLLYFVTKFLVPSFFNKFFLQQYNFVLGWQKHHGGRTTSTAWSNSANLSLRSLLCNHLYLENSETIFEGDEEIHCSENILVRFIPDEYFIIWGDVKPNFFAKNVAI